MICFISISIVHHRNLTNLDWLRYTYRTMFLSHPQVQEYVHSIHTSTRRLLISAFLCAPACSALDLSLCLFLCPTSSDRFVLSSLLYPFIARFIKPIERVRMLLWPIKVSGRMELLFVSILSTSTYDIITKYIVHSIYRKAHEWIVLRCIEQSPTEFEENSRAIIPFFLFLAVVDAKNNEVYSGERCKNHFVMSTNWQSVHCLAPLSCYQSSVQPKFTVTNNNNNSIVQLSCVALVHFVPMSSRMKHDEESN